MTSEGNQILGRVYKIVSSETDKVYIGSTIRPLYERMSVHKEKYKLYMKGTQHYVTSFDIVKFNDACIVLLHEGLFDTKSDLHRLEGQFMLTTENCINRFIAGRDKKEYYKLHADEIKQYQVEYRKNNKDKINEYRRNVRLQRVEKSGQRKRELVDDHSNDPTIELRKRLIQCPICKSYLRHGGQARHLKTSKHVNALSQTTSV